MVDRSELVLRTKAGEGRAEKTPTKEAHSLRQSVTPSFFLAWRRICHRRKIGGLWGVKSGSVGLSMRNSSSKRGGRELMANVLAEKLADRLRVKREGGTNGSCPPACRRRGGGFVVFPSGTRWSRRTEEGGTVGVGGKKRSRGKRSVVVCGIVGIGQEFDAPVGLLHFGCSKVGVRDNGRRCFTAQKSRGWLAKEGRGGSVRGSKTTRIDSKD